MHLFQNAHSFEFANRYCPSIKFILTLIDIETHVDIEVKKMVLIKSLLR